MKGAPLDLTPSHHPAYGMSVNDLVNAHRRASNFARYRIGNQGAREYDETDHQKFEGMDPHRLLYELRCEIADSINYLVFLDIQLSRWQTRIEEIDA